MRQIVGSVAEKKYYDESYTKDFAREGTTAGTSGHSLTFLNYPGVGTSAVTRVGNKISVRSFVLKATVFGKVQANVNIQIPFTIYVIANKDGGTFLADSFLVPDATAAGALTTRSMRNLEYFREFQVLGQKDYTFTADNYQGNNGGIIQCNMAMRCSLPVRFPSTGSTTPLENQIAVLLVAADGSLLGGSGLTCVFNTRFYFTDV